MENIFEKLLGRAPKFGDWFMTSEGYPVRYVTNMGNPNIAMVCEPDNGVIKHVGINGHIILGSLYAEKQFITGLYSPADEVMLSEKAPEWISFVKDDNILIKTIAIECAKIGYRKAKEIN